MITDFGHVMTGLSSCLDLARGFVPEDQWAISLVVRCKEESVPAHFLIGDDPEPVIAETLRKIGTGPVLVGVTNRDEVGEPIPLGPVPGEVVSMQITDPATEVFVNLADLTALCTAVQEQIDGIADMTQLQDALERVLPSLGA